MAHRIMGDGEVRDPCGALHIRGMLAGRVGCHVIDRGEMDDVIDLDVVVVDAKAVDGEIPDDRVDAVRTGEAAHGVDESGQ